LYEKDVEEIDERPRKRRKVEVMGKKQGKAVVKGLLGGYGSSEDEEEGSGDQGSPGDWTNWVNTRRAMTREKENWKCPTQMPWVIQKALVLTMKWSTQLS
jgi:hypothetical protein